jgi:hypothetical protein
MAFEASLILSRLFSEIEFLGLYSMPSLIKALGMLGLEGARVPCGVPVDGQGNHPVPATPGGKMTSARRIFAFRPR